MNLHCESECGLFEISESLFLECAFLVMFGIKS